MSYKCYHVCDRCKREYREDRLHCSIVRIKRRPGFTIEFGLTDREVNDRYGFRESFELCAECRKKLYAFMDGGAEE